MFIIIKNKVKLINKKNSITILFMKMRINYMSNFYYILRLCSLL